MRDVPKPKSHALGPCVFEAIVVMVLGYKVDTHKAGLRRRGGRIMQDVPKPKSHALGPCVFVAIVVMVLGYKVDTLGPLLLWTSDTK